MTLQDQLYGKRNSKTAISTIANKDQTNIQ